MNLTAANLRKLITDDMIQNAREFASNATPRNTSGMEAERETNGRIWRGYFRDHLIEAIDSAAKKADAAADPSLAKSA